MGFPYILGKPILRQEGCLFRTGKATRFFKRGAVGRPDPPMRLVAFPQKIPCLISPHDLFFASPLASPYNTSSADVSSYWPPLIQCPAERKTPWTKAVSSDFLPMCSTECSTGLDGCDRPWGRPPSPGTMCSTSPMEHKLGRVTNGGIPALRSTTSRSTLPTVAFLPRPYWKTFPRMEFAYVIFRSNSIKMPAN